MLKQITKDDKALKIINKWIDDYEIIIDKVEDNKIYSHKENNHYIDTELSFYKYIISLMEDSISMTDEEYVKIFTNEKNILVSYISN